MAHHPCLASDHYESTHDECDILPLSEMPQEGESLRCFLSAIEIGFDISFRKLKEKPMIECQELAGKVVQRCTVDKDALDGPEIHIEFTDETVFCVGLKSRVSIETKHPSGHAGIKIVGGTGSGT